MEKILLIIMIYLSFITSIISQNDNNGLYASSENQGINSEAFGWNDKEDSTLMKVNSIFNIHSMTKTFTGAGIQILIENEKLRLYDKASDYLPGFRNPKSKEITIEQLLTHRSGLPLSVIQDFNEFNSLIELANAIGEIESFNLVTIEKLNKKQ